MIGKSGTVYLVGAGPGDPGLITVRGRHLLRRANVVVHDRLIGHELLREIGAGVQVIDVGKAPGAHRYSQHEINELLVHHAQAGRSVVRLKGGDPFLFGRGWEELSACREAGVSCIVVPGVTSAIAAPAAAGIPVTLRNTARSFAVVTAKTDAGDGAKALDYDALARLDTVVILMGRSLLTQVTRGLVAAGRSPDTPAACIERGTTSSQRQVIATLGTIAACADREGLRAPVVTCVGDVAACGLVRPKPNVTEGGRPLESKRIVLTKASSSSNSMIRLLQSAGATTVECPMIRIENIGPSARLNQTLGSLGQVDWIVFTSVHGVRGFFKRLRMIGTDARALAACRIAAVGPATARSLGRFGLVADFVPGSHCAEGLISAFSDRIRLPGSRILLARGDIAGRELPDELRRAGVVVSEAVMYRTLPATPTESQLEAIRRKNDAIVFCSPSAVRQFVSLGFGADGAVVACIGPTTAAAARDAGLPVDVVAEKYSATGLVEALERFFTRVRATA